jgi:FixJ family two-component response regulator
MMESTTMVYVVDDDKRAQEALHHLLESHGYNAMSFDQANTFLAFPKPNVPSCLILDIDLGNTSGLDVQQRLIGVSAMPIIFLAGVSDIRTTVKAMRGGASEVLSKPVDGDELIKAVETALVRAEEEWADIQIMRQIRNSYGRLTRREREVLTYIVRGFLNKQTAYELGTSEITIRIHRGQIMRKMNADSLADLVRIAALLGIPGQKSPVTAQKNKGASSESFPRGGFPG